ncbi:MAG TPA: glycoside hydrolase family 16 protein [Solirubrobacteraceae bacterium]|nr:glycoside hydrolase family 16 protein [Solirubrobacteraceae bacterium]
MGSSDSGTLKRAAAAPAATDTKNTLPPTTRKLVFEDNFNGTKVDRTAWNLYRSPGHDGFGLRRPSAFSVEDGKLVITAKMRDGEIVSGGMSNKLDHKYGRYVVRVRTETDPTATMSGVALTNPDVRVAEHTENDWYETGHRPSRKPFYSYIHYGVENNQVRFKHDADASEWHVMVMDWSRDSIKLYRDGKFIAETRNRTAIPDVKMHACLQLDAFADNTLKGPVRMFVDYIRIYH